MLLMLGIILVLNLLLWLESVLLRCKVWHVLVYLGMLRVWLLVAAVELAGSERGLTSRVEKDASRAVLAVGEVSAWYRLGNFGRREVGLLLWLLRMLLVLLMLGIGAVLGVELGRHRHGLMMTHELHRKSIHWLGVKERKHDWVVGESGWWDDGTCCQELSDYLDVVGPDSKNDRCATSAHV